MAMADLATRLRLASPAGYLDSLINIDLTVSLSHRATLPAGCTWFVSLRATGSCDGIGDADLEAYSGKLRVNVPLN